MEDLAKKMHFLLCRSSCRSSTIATAAAGDSKLAPVIHDLRNLEKDQNSLSNGVLEKEDAISIWPYFIPFKVASFRLRGLKQILQLFKKMCSFPIRKLLSWGYLP